MTELGLGMAFILLYNYQKQLKSYKLKTPCELVIENYQKYS
jgi:hypothetical protein